MKTEYEEFEEYHTSADSLKFIDSKSFGSSFGGYIDIINTLGNEDFINMNPLYELKPGKRGLYDTLGGRKEVEINGAEYSGHLIFVMVKIHYGTSPKSLE